jgi:phosphatidate cytidylyltransferase
MGAILVVLAIGVLVLDQRWAPAYPCLLVLLLGLAELACVELLALLPASLRPPRWLGLGGVALLVVANWPAHLAPFNRVAVDPWFWISSAFAIVVLVAFLVEMAAFREPGVSVPRIALAVWSVAYLGVLPGFFAQLRWRTPAASGQGIDPGTLVLALAIFVPKCGDIGAYFTGRFLGRHRMTPVLSPKKTWEGAAGGLTASVLVAIGINQLGPVIPYGLAGAIGFGLSVGIAGMLGDLAESLIKRDCRTKDASQVVPGFGGVLDVVDAVVFAAPVAYWWLH